MKNQCESLLNKYQILLLLSRRLLIKVVLIMAEPLYAQLQNTSPSPREQERPTTTDEVQYTEIVFDKPAVENVGAKVKKSNTQLIMIYLALSILVIIATVAITRLQINPTVKVMSISAMVLSSVAICYLHFL